ncbi:MAG: YabP/YqfC family sporulation protein [Clostridia bacterium]|nr:YabP/YqfC family sporulation protein [Clostridia bacterium]MBQ7047937.1 YabP/YqfC family sporulation protein [Clostridia bacterium]
MENMGLSSPTFEMYGRRTLQAQGVMTLVEYTREQVIMLCKSSRIRIRGEDLQVALLSKNRAMVTGLIKGLDFF